MAAEMQPRTPLYALAEVFANLALQTLLQRPITNTNSQELVKRQS